MYETLRIVNKLKPKIVIWENVKNLLNEKHIHNFEKYLEIMEQLGYKNYYKVLNAKNYGVPQNRKRIFTISIRKDVKISFKFPIEIELNKTYKDFLVNDYGTDVVLTPKELTKVKGFGANYAFGGSVLKGDIYPTITASYGKTSGNSGKIKCKEGYRILTPKECWRLMGFDDEDFDKASKVCRNSQLYKQAGNSICVNVLEAVLRSLFSDDLIYKQNEIIDNITKLLVEPYNYIDKAENARKEKFLFDRGSSFILQIENFAELIKKINNKYLKEDGRVNYNCVKLLEAINIRYSEDRFVKQDVDLNIDDLIKLFDRKGNYAKNDLKKEIKNYLSILRNIKIMYRTTEGSYIQFRICNKETSIVKDRIHFVMSKELYELLKDEGVYSYMPSKILHFHKEQHIYWIYKTLLAIHNKLEVDEFEVNVSTLYKECSSIKRYEKVRASNRNFKGDIKLPIEDSLNSINCISWKYVDEVTSKYNKWINARIRIRWKEQPNID